MVYKARSEKLALLILFIAIITLNTLGEKQGGIFSSILPFIILILGAFVQFKLIIKPNSLQYEISWLKLTIFTKVVYPEQIGQLKFQRVRWMTKSVKIQLKKGIPIRILDFKPLTIFDDLTSFANEHKIPILKTKDYRMIEKD